MAGIRKLWRGTLIVNRPGRAREQIGTMVLANPDFVERLKTHAPMNPPEHAIYYGGDAKGYMDAPSLGDTAA